MDPPSDQQYTPQKLLKKQFNISSPVTFKFLSHQQNSRIIVRTPQSKFLHSSLTKTPGSIKKPTSSNNSTTISSSNSSTAYNIFPILNTPPSRTRFTKVLNPFEAALTDRLHLPLTFSPSLFQCPATPEHSSTQFEWTIDDISSLGPANVEPHESQFLGDSLDPDIEAKAQAAISSYFKEQQIVPSPQNCPLNNQRIILAENSTNNSILMQSPIIKPPKRIRDGYTQTILTLPPILPLELENILKPYFKFNENQQQSSNINCDIKSNNISIDYEARDASLRRKLFDIPNCDGGGDINTSDDDGLINCNEFSPPPKSPQLEIPSLSLRYSGESLDKSSFGALSPISKLISPRKFTKQYSDDEQQQQQQQHGVIQNSSNLENISPIKSSSPTTTTAQIIKKNTPIIFIKKSSSPLKNNIQIVSLTDNNEIHLQQNITLNQSNLMSVDNNFNNSIQNLIGDSNTIDNQKPEENIQQQEQKSLNSQQQKLKSLCDVAIFNQSGNYFDDVMQVSQLSTKSTSSTSSINDTPKRRRSVGRKNLSQSFSCQYSDTEDDNINDNSPDNNKIDQNDNEDNNNVLVKRRPSPNNDLSKTNNECIKKDLIIGNCSILAENINAEIKFYRTDSGFNEMSTNTQDEILKYQKNFDSDKENVSKFQEYENLKNISKCEMTTCLEDDSINHDVSMICCSTPSKRMEL